MDQARGRGSSGGTRISKAPSSRRLDRGAPRQSHAAGQHASAALAYAYAALAYAYGGDALKGGPIGSAKC